MHEGAPEIVVPGGAVSANVAAGRRKCSLARVVRIRRDMYIFVGFKPVFKRGQPDDGFENGAGRVILLGGAVVFRAQIWDFAAIRPA